MTLALSERFSELDKKLICFTRVSSDATPTNSSPNAPLSKIEFAVKDLFDIAGWPTTAGAKFRESANPAIRDAEVIQRLRNAGANFQGTTNMDEFAYGFATENAHYGITKNPYDLACLAGGSSGGSAAAVAAGLVDMSLGSDTNGSVRVPASLCGIFGLRPTFGALSVDGVYPFVERLDTVGIFTRSIDVMRTSFEMASGQAATSSPSRPLKVARLDGWFRKNSNLDGLGGCDAIAEAFGDGPLIDLPLAEQGRSAAFLITAYEGGRLHLESLKQHFTEYDAATRDRLLAGALLPDAVFEKAIKASEAFKVSLLAALETYDILIAPATPTSAPNIASGTIELNGQKVSARAHLGLYTQPLSFSGVPILSVPLNRPDQLPLGVQLIARHGQEQLLFDAAQTLMDSGVVAYTPPYLVEANLC